MNISIINKNLKAKYKNSKEAKVGETCKCPSCGKSFVKKAYQQAFCGNKIDTTCKDFYWNNVTPNKRNNTTRISPANAKWQGQKRDFIDFDEDQSWDAHKID